MHPCHFADGVQFDPCRCPIALALQDLGWLQASVGTHTAHVVDCYGSPAHQGFYELPEDAVRYVRRFDTNRRDVFIHPVTFKLKKLVV